MSQITNTPNANSINQLGLETITDNLNKAFQASTGVNLPPIATAAIASELMTLPSLEKPNGTLNLSKIGSLSSIMGGISLEVLIDALGNENRKIATKDGIESIKARGQERKEVNDKQLEEMKKNLEEMGAKKVLNGFLKALKWIGMIIGAIAAVAITAVGAATGNPALIAAGAIMIAMTINSIVSEATDGKVSIAAGIGAIAKACGASDEAAKWIGFGFEMAINLTAVALSFGGAAAGSAASVGTQVADKTAQVAGTIAKISAFANAGASIASGATSIASSVLDYNSALSRAEQKELEAILQRLNIAIEVENDFLKAIMEKSEKLMQAVGDIVQNNAETNTALLTGAPPAMA